MSAKFLLILLTLLFSLSSCIQPLGGEKGLSDIQDGHTPFLNKPEAFEITNVTAYDKALTITWGDSTRALGYSVKYGTSSGSYNNIVSSCLTSPCHITGLTNGQSYFLMVTATNAAGSLDAKSEKIGIPSDLPSVPTSLAAVGTGTSIQLNWSVSTGPGSITYNVSRSTTSGSGFTSIATSLTSPSFTDSAVTNTTTYYYMVSATNANGTSVNSSEVSAVPMTPPSIPSSLAATAGNANTILNWNASTGLGTISYNVLRSTTSGSGYSILASGVSATTYTDSTASNGVAYYYVVSSTNAGGTSARSNQVSSTPLSIPTISSININGSGSVALSFSASTGATSYNIKYGTSSNTYTTTLTNVTSPTTISSLTAGTLYYFRVIAANANGSVESSESTARPMASFAISSTTIASSTEIALAWGASTGSASYTVKYGTASGVHSTTFSTTATSPTTITGLTPGTAYFFMVTAVNASGALNATAQSSLTPIAIPSTPSTLAASGTNGSAALTWTASTGSGTITYNILRSSTSGSGYASIATAVSANNYTDSTVTNGTTYYYVVTSTNAGGTSANSNQASALPMLPPTTPSSLAATITASDVDLSWSASTGLGTISYNVYRSTTSGSGYTSIATGLSTTNYSDSIPTPGTIYYYVVTATNAGGATANSNQATAVTMPVPTISSIAVNGSGSLLLSFAATAGASSYNIKYGTSTNTYTTTITGATTPATISGLTPGTNYYFKVTAVNSNGTVDSSESSATPLGSFAISSTTIASSTSVSLVWGASTGASSYTVKYGTASGVYGTTFSATATSPTTITGLTAGTTYYFMVMAVNANGSLNANAETTLAPIAVPSIPSTLAASGTNGSVALTWTASTGSGTITYNILRSSTSGSGYASIATAVSANNYTDSTVTNGTTYYYVVTSTNAGGTSANSNQASALPMLPPTAPSSLVATVGTANAQLNWSPASGLGTITYNILRSTTSGSGYTTLATSVSATTYADLSALNNTTYYYVVSATNAGGTSFNSNEVEAKPLSLPTITSIAVNGSGSVSLAFSASSGATSYNIKYGTSTNTYTTTVTGATTPATISGLTAGTTYYFRVTAANSTGSVDSSESSTIPLGSFTISSAVASAANQITLSWGASLGASSYTVKYGTASGVYGTTFSSSATSPLPVTGLVAGTTYYFMVTAVNTSGNLNATAELSATTATLSSVPGSVVASFTAASTIDLGWSASTGTSGITYNVYRSTTSGSGYAVLSACNAITTTSCSDSTPTPGTTYYYVVTSSNIAGESAYSSQVSAKAISAFSLSSVVQSGLTQATLTWGSSTGATLYTVKYGTTSGNYPTSAGTSVSTSFDITSLTNGVTYYFMVYASNTTGSAPASSELSLLINSNPTLSLNLLNSIIPAIGNATPTFSRTSIATMVDFEGVLRTVKSNEVRFSGARRVENLILPSVYYTGAPRWAAFSSAVATANSAIAPDGTNTATYLDLSADPSARYAYDASGITATKTNMGYVFSIYLKSASVAGTYSVRYRDGDANYVTVPLNIDTTWRRYSIYVSPKAGTTSLLFYPGVYSAGLNKAYFWGSQLEEVPTIQTVTTASEYVSCGVLTAPYQGSGVDCVQNFITLNGNTVNGSYLMTEAVGTAISSSTAQGFLAESSMANLSTYSEILSNTTYLKTNATVTDNVAVAPDGATTADKLVEDTSTLSHEISQQFAATSGQIYTASIFIKTTSPVQRRYMRVQFLTSIFSASAAGIIDLQTGALLNTPANVSISITPFINGWYRVNATATASSTGTGRIYYTLASDSAGTNVYTGDGSSGVYLWGSQVENNNYASSYIPTSTTLTRPDDTLSYPISGVIDTLSNYTIFGEAKLTSILTLTSRWQTLIGSDSGRQPMVRLSQGPGTPPITFFSNDGSDGTYSAKVTAGTDATKLFFHKFTARKTSTSLDAFYDGTSGVSSGIGTQVVNPSVILIGTRQLSGQRQGLNGNVKSIKIWQLPLTNSDISGL